MLRLNRGQLVRDSLAVEAAFAGDLLIQNNAEGEDASALVDGFPAGLFRTHVAGSTDDLPR